MTTDPTTTPATVDTHTALMAALAAWREDVRPWLDPPKTDPLLSGAHTTDRDLAAAYDAYAATPTPATVDGADLLALIRRGINDPGSVLPRETVDLSDGTGVYDERIGAWGARAVLKLLTAAGWPNTQPDNPHVTAAREARAEVDRLQGILAEVPDRPAHANLADSLAWLVDRYRHTLTATRERDEAERALARAKEQLGESLSWDAKADFARVREELRQAELGWANTRKLLDKACRWRDAERERADNLARALRRLVNLKDGPRDSEYYEAKMSAWRDARALLDGPTPAPNTTPEHHDEQTLFKVLTALVRSGLSEYAAQVAISEMTNDGILFRERGGPASPASSPTTDPATPDGGQDTAEAQEGAQAVPAHEEAPFAGDEYNGFTLTAHNAIPKSQNAVIRLTRDGALIRAFLYPAYRVWTLLAHWHESDEVNSDATTTTDATETGADHA